MAEAITILVGTMTGTADIVAEDVEQALRAGGHDVLTRPMDDLDAAVFAPGGIFLICTSTYGNGDVPDNAQALYDSIAAERPDLSAVRYGLIALGDSTYTGTFCHGGLRFDALLRELGATRVGEPLLHDASAGTIPEQVAAEWAPDWAGQIVAPAD